MATITRRTVTIDELPEVLERLNREPVSPETIARRRKLTAEIRKLRDQMEPLPEGVKDIIRRQRGEEPIG